MDDAQKLVEKTGEKVKNKSADLADKIRPRFDAYTPDTRYNKRRFRDFLKIELTEDIHDIYCYDDAIGIDADYQFGFHCSPKTAQRIIRINKLKADSLNSDYALGLQNDFSWWNKKKIEKLELYLWKDPSSEYYKYFWYDSREQKAYFFDFDM